MNIKEYFKRVKTEVDKTLNLCLPTEDTYPIDINKAMRYSIFAGGKRLRPILLVAACEVTGCNRNKALPFAAAIEIIHTYTLIHDDLPSLDNDDLRRGNLTNHKKFGEAMAILAGDGLLTLAFEIMSDELTLSNLNPVIACKAINEISKAVGVSGTIGGQVIDIQSEGKEIDIKTLEYIHTNKTGKMITASVRTGGMIGECSDAELLALTKYSQNIGLAFQIVDDILDIEGDQDELGKDIGSDEDNFKATYPKLLGLEESKKRADKLIEDAYKNLEIFGEKGNLLKEIADFIVKRRS